MRHQGVGILRPSESEDLVDGWLQIALPQRAAVKAYISVRVKTFVASLTCKAEFKAKKKNGSQKVKRLPQQQQKKSRFRKDRG